MVSPVAFLPVAWYHLHIPERYKGREVAVTMPGSGAGASQAIIEVQMECRQSQMEPWRTQLERQEWSNWSAGGIKWRSNGAKWSDGGGKWIAGGVKWRLFENQGLGAAGQGEASSGISWTGRNVAWER